MSHTFAFRPGTVDEIIFRAVNVGNEYRLPDSFAPDDIIIDIGTHIGSFCHAALVRGSNHVYGFEACPENFDCATRNLAPYGDRVTVERRAVWRSDRPSGSLSFNELRHVNNSAGTVLQTGGTPVEAVAFDDVIRRVSHNGRKRVRLVKLDCEGSEYPILLTSKALHLVDQIVGEYHNFGPEHPADHPFHHIPEEARVEGTERFSIMEIVGALRIAGFDVRTGYNEYIPTLSGWFNARRVERPLRLNDQFRWHRDGLKYKASRFLKRVG